MIQSLNEIKQVSGRDLDGQVDENTLIAGETSAGVFGVFKFLPAVKNAVKNFFVGIAKATVAGTTKIAVVKDDGTIEYISADDILAYKNAKEETIAGKKTFTNGIVADVEGENINAENVNATEINTTNVTVTGAIKSTTAEVDSLTVSNSADLPNYYKKSETYSKSEIDNKTSVFEYKVGNGNKVCKQGKVCTIQFTSFYLGKDYSSNENIMGLGNSEIFPRSLVRFNMFQLNSLRVVEVFITAEGLITVGQTNIMPAGYWVGTVTYFTL